MGSQGFNRQWARQAEAYFRQNSGRGRRGGWGEWTDAPRGHRPGHQGPPPWVAGLFGLQQGGSSRGPRVRRGDVRSAILDVLRTAREEDTAINGYQVIQQITERSQGAWRPSPGSVYPTIQQLEDEGLVDNDETRGRRALRLTDAGASYAADHADELDAVWRPFDREAEPEAGSGVDLKREIGQVMSAVWQLVSTGSDTQRRAALEVLVDARRKLYGILADGPDPDEADPDVGADGPADGAGRG